MPTNTYLARWFDLFLRPIDPTQTAREVAFLRRWLPQPTYSRLVDVCCGPGRHSHLLAEAGYTITGIDRDPAAVPCPTKPILNTICASCASLIYGRMRCCVCESGG